MKGREKEVIDALKEPDEIKQSRRDIAITTYITDRIKEGEQIWKK